MTVWIVKNFEDQIVDVFKNVDSAVNYLMSEVERWHDEFPEDIDKSLLMGMRELILNEYVNESRVIHAGFPDDENFYLRAIQFDVKE